MNNIIISHAHSSAFDDHLTFTIFYFVYGAFPLMRFSSRAAAVRLGTFVATMHFQRSVSIDAAHTQLYASCATGDMPVNSKDTDDR